MLRAGQPFSNFRIVWTSTQLHSKHNHVHHGTAAACTIGASFTNFRNRERPQKRNKRRRKISKATRKHILFAASASWRHFFYSFDMALELITTKMPCLAMPWRLLHVYLLQYQRIIARRFGLTVAKFPFQWCARYEMPVSKKCITWRMLKLCFNIDPKISTTNWNHGNDSIIFQVRHTWSRCEVTLVVHYRTVYWRIYCKNTYVLDILSWCL